jgi:catechol 2,3-dioxygenase-like lactoylglutathione lyase family enzyme
MHASFYVSDIQNSIAFYNKFFGQVPSKIKPKYAKYTLEKSALVISFIENKERVRSSFGHLGFQLETVEELKQRLEDAKAENLVSREEIGTHCCYAKQDKFWVNDPDGIQWEVYYFHADAEFNDPNYELEQSNKCCSELTANQISDCSCKTENAQPACC